ncbi:uncharacterized protein LOC119653699 isoform X3 [Hermetia illucens]|nr:uncharacterized protein LOC119653699 isoform X3 [Hermetia illucens]
MAAMAEAKAKARTDEDGIADVLGESRGARTAVSKPIPKNLTLAAPEECVERKCEQEHGMEFAKRSQVTYGGSSVSNGAHSDANDNIKRVSRDGELIELTVGGDNENDDNNDESANGDKPGGGGYGKHGGERCEGVVCNSNDNSRSYDGRNGDTAAAVAAEKGEMAQCALHSIFSTATTSKQPWTWTTEKTKSSCFMISCKTCAKRIFHCSPSPPSSSSLCVHGRRRGRRNSTSTSSIRKEDAVSEATQATVEQESAAEGQDSREPVQSKSEQVNSHFPKIFVPLGDCKCVSSCARKSVFCLDALKQLLLAEGDGDLVLVQDGNSNQVKSVVEAINHVVRTRKSLENRVQAAVEKRKQVSFAKSVLVKDCKRPVKDSEFQARNVIEFAENQSCNVQNSHKSAANEQCVNGVEHQTVKRSGQAENNLCADNLPVNFNEWEGERLGPFSPYPFLSEDFSEKSFDETTKVPFELPQLFSSEGSVSQVTNSVYESQPTPIPKGQSVGVTVTSNENINGESSFVASNRLKRLEEHFKGFVFTKKLLKDESLVAVTDSDCSNNSLNHCDLGEQQIAEATLTGAFCELDAPDSSLPEKFHDKSTPLHPETTLVPRLYNEYTSLREGNVSSISLCNDTICKDNKSAGPQEESIYPESVPTSKQDARCLQVLGKRQTPTSIHSSLSTATGPSTFVIRTDLQGLRIDQKHSEFIQNNNKPPGQVHSNVFIDSLGEKEETKQESAENYTKKPRTDNQLKDKQQPLDQKTQEISSGKLRIVSEQKAVYDSQDSATTLLRCVNKPAECQSHDASNNNNNEARNDEECTRRPNSSPDKSERYTLETEPPPLPPRQPPSARRSASASNDSIPSKRLFGQNNDYDYPLSVTSLRNDSQVPRKHEKGDVLDNNNISYLECASGSQSGASSFFSLPILPQRLPPLHGEVSCCEFDVRYFHNFQDSDLTFECYDEFGVENCCENNYCYIGNDAFASPCSSSSSGSSSSTSGGPATSHCRVIETVPLFQYQNHQTLHQEPTHSNLHHYLHYCHVVPADDSTMRELNGPLRGLLKKPNRPPPARKNRVVFDETRNEFFEADYIILIREDCAYDDEDEEPCTCGEHELVRLCCEEGCQCNYSEDNVTPQITSLDGYKRISKADNTKSPKYAPPIEFVDEAALSPPDGYKDNGLNALSGALSGHVFGAQHIQQLQVIQRLQQQRAAMLAARASNQQSQPSQQNQQQQAQVATSPAEEGPIPVCTECAECVECAAKQLQDEECVAVQCQEDIAQLSVPHVALVPLHNNSPERRITQKEIIAGEERPKYVAVSQHKDAEDEGMEKILSVHKNQRYVVETITMTTVTERRIVRESTEETTIKNVGTAASSTPATADVTPNDRKPPIPAKPENIPAQISGILKGGKLWKNEMQAEETIHPTSDDDTNSKRSVRFITEGAKEGSKEGCEGQSQTGEKSADEEPISELIPLKKHSTLFHNVWRPNSAVRQLFPAGIHSGAPATALTHEALKAFEESKRGGLVSNLLTVGGSDTDTIRRTIERNALRRSLIKKKSMKPDISLEERIKQLTCDIDDPTENSLDDQNSASLNPYSGEDLERRDSPAGEENPSQAKYIPDKSFSPSSSASSSSSGSTSAYRKISDIFNRDRRQEKIPEAEENPIVIIPQECRCPAAPDLGMGVQVPAAHTQIHQTPPRQTEPRRQFLSTLAPLTACVAGQKDDFSYYTLAAADRNSTASAQCSDYSLGDIEAALAKDESRKVAPDVIAGTPGQEQDELVIFAQQEANRTDKIKKRYSNEHQNQAPASNASSDDDEQNDYGFNKRPTVRGIKAKFEATNEIIQEMQAQLSQTMNTQQQNTGKPFNALKQTNSIGSTSSKPQPQVQPPNNNVPQNPAERPAWGYYTEDQRADLIQHPNYYQALPAHFKQTFHSHEESLMYQNCQSVSMEQHYGRFAARSPSRRPESPPPLRNYHQTMVLIPYNTQSYAQFSTSNDQQSSAHQFRRQNVLEYQQVTQQTIRVPIGYTIPGMQLHLVAGRGTHQHQQQQQVQFSQNPRLVAPRTFNIPQQPHDVNNMKFAERGVPEGSASISHSDCKNVMSPTSTQGGQNQCNQTSQVSPAVPGAVFYAMNV